MSERHASLKAGDPIELPLAQLILSRDNPRKTAAKDADPVLCASIRSVGLLQNLGVRPSASSPGKFEVRFGGRRLRALRQLAREGHFHADARFSCRIVSDDDAAAEEAALAENVAREAMNPVDEFEAFSRLEENGMSVADIARCFGAGETLIRQRLALGRAARCVRKALRSGEISLDIARLFAGSPDAARQERVYKAMKERGGFSEYSVRRLLNEGVVASDDDLAAFIGLSAYEAAGGRVEKDLFSDEVRLVDIDIVYRLRDARLAAQAQQLSEEGWSWIETLESHSWQALQGFDRIYGERAEPSQEDALEIERLAGALEAFDAKDEDDMSEADWDEVDRLEETLASLRAGTRLYTAEQKAIAGCVIYPGRAGVEIHEGLVRRQDRKKAARLSQGENGGKGRDGAPSPAYGKALRADLGVYKAQALQAALAGEPALAALALQFACIWQALAPHDAESLGGVRLAAMPADLRVTKGELGETGAARRLGAIEASLRTDIFAQGGWRGAWEKFRELSGEDQAALAAFAFARLIEPAAADEGFADVLGRSLGWRIRDYWTPTAENFFSRIRKDQLVRFLTETMGEASAACLTRDFKAKKKDIAALCERLVEGRAPASPDERAAIDAWTPEEMRLCEKEPGQSANDCAAANDGKASMTQAE